MDSLAKPPPIPKMPFTWKEYLVAAFCVIAFIFRTTLAEDIWLSFQSESKELEPSILKSPEINEDFLKVWSIETINPKIGRHSKSWWRNEEVGGFFTYELRGLLRAESVSKIRRGSETYAVYFTKEGDGSLKITRIERNPSFY